MNDEGQDEELSEDLMDERIYSYSIDEIESKDPSDEETNASQADREENEILVDGGKDEGDEDSGVLMEE